MEIWRAVTGDWCQVNVVSVGLRFCLRNSCMPKKTWIFPEDSPVMRMSPEHAKDMTSLSRKNSRHDT